MMIIQEYAFSYKIKYLNEKSFNKFIFEKLDIEIILHIDVK